MFRSAGCVAAAVVSLVAATASDAQILLPTRQHDTLDVEIKSLRDDITLYLGDPQELLLMDVNPKQTSLPRVNYAGQANAVLQILDQELAETAASERAEGKEKDAPYGQRWEVRISPSGPTSFSVQCEQGKSAFDFTDFQVRKIDLSANRSVLDVGFRSQNPIVLESCSIQANGGALRFHGLLNARAKQIALFVPGVECQIELTGKSFEGTSEITLQGQPQSLQMSLSRKVGVRIAGPAATTARFAAAHMVQEGDDWVSRDYDKAKCQVRLTFADDISKLAVKWE